MIELAPGAGVGYWVSEDVAQMQVCLIAGVTAVQIRLPRCARGTECDLPPQYLEPDRVPDPLLRDGLKVTFHKAPSG